MEEEWTVDANEAITISLVAIGETGLTRIESFNPKFTYPIFGEDERIFGYKGLKVNLQYNASDLRPNLSISSIRKFRPVGDIEPVDVARTMKQFLPGVAFQNKENFQLELKQVPDKWTPPGELIRTTEREGETYEIWKGSLADPAIKQLVRRIQILVLFYIEGGSFIGEDADGNDEPDYSLARWSVFFLYKKTQVPGKHDSTKFQYIFQGYSTVYHFWMYEPPTPPTSPGKKVDAAQPKTDGAWELPEEDLPYTELPHRARISQFVILPPFQGKGIGAVLYNSIYDLHTTDACTKEVTVEDPNEAFDLLRDLCDLKHLRKNVPEFADLKVNADINLPQKNGSLHHDTSISDGTAASSKGIVDIVALEDLRVKVKIAPRQFARLVEIHLMSQLPQSVKPSSDIDKTKNGASKEDRHIYTLWRLLLKQRLYRRNASVLGEFEITERIIKLNETLENVEWEYARTLERLETPRPGAVKNGKRKADEGAEDSIPASKKTRVGEA